MMRGNRNMPWLRLGVGFCAAVMAISGCVNGQAGGPVSETPSSALVEEITYTTDDEINRVEIECSSSTPYSAFKLLDPSRIIVDVLGEPGPELPGALDVGQAPVDRITTESVGEQIPTTRITLYLEGEPDYGIVENGDVIVLNLFPHSTEAEPPAELEAPRQEESAGQGVQPAEPRLFFPSKSEPLNLVRGVDFTMLEGGKSRFIVTTSDEAVYSLRRAGEKAVMLVLEKCMIPDLLKREVDSRYFEGVIEKAEAKFVPDGSRVEILLNLKEMVPYHAVQEKDEIRLDFYDTSVQPPKVEVEPTPQTVSSGKGPQQSSPALKQHNGAEAAVNGVEINTSVSPEAEKKYTGTPMTMEFVDADVTNILRLIGEVSNLNIIWGPEVTGTVSMRLRKVPWDQALDLVLDNNGLAKEVRGNVIWITTRDKMESIKAAERKAEEEERKRKLAETQEMKELEPLETRYFPLDFSNAGEVKKHLDEIKTKDRGTVTVDERTNTLIMRDTGSTLAEAEKIIERFDTAVKQIMIEARIVDATTGFTRDLGVEWEGTYERYRDRTPFAGSFATNAPQGWAGNIGFSIARITSRGLATLDASLALAESENKATIISAPRVIASNGEEAVISRGDEIYREIVTADQIKTETFEATLSLTVTPTVSFNDFVTMKLQVTDDKPYEDGSGKTKKEIDTTLMVKSGETIVIGGIYTEDKQDSVSGIPFLRKVPLLGWLFKANTKISGKTELLIFVTPRVIEASGSKGSEGRKL